VGRIIGYAYVVADLLHFGHLLHLENCKRMCDILVVGVLTNKATMEKKPEPIMSFDERLSIISALRCVDAAVTQETYSPLNNIYDIKPDILFESSSHDNPTVNPFGRTVEMPYYINQSSTKIKRRILEEEHANRN